jgi:uncharacterized coiled-coil DUF342 family protein
MKLAEDEFKSKLQQSEAVINGLKNELKAKEEVLKSNNQTLTLLQTNIDDVTNKLKSLNQSVQRLFEKPQHVSTCNIAAFILSK